MCGHSASTTLSATAWTYSFPYIPVAVLRARHEGGNGHQLGPTVFAARPLTSQRPNLMEYGLRKQMGASAPNYQDARRKWDAGKTPSRAMSRGRGGRRRRLQVLDTLPFLQSLFNSTHSPKDCTSFSANARSPLASLPARPMLVPDSQHIVAYLHRVHIGPKQLVTTAHLRQTLAEVLSITTFNQQMCTQPLETHLTHPLQRLL